MSDLEYNEYIFSESEAKAALVALDYMYHRQTHHNKAHFISPENLEEIRTSLRKELGL